MTEFEAATIASQNATLAFQEATLAYEFYGLLATFVIGLLQCALIAWGLSMMHKAGQRRDRQLDRQEKTLEDIGAGIREQSAGIREQSAGIREQSAGIRALLERPAQ